MMKVSIDGHGSFSVSSVSGDSIADNLPARNSGPFLHSGRPVILTAGSTVSAYWLTQREHERSYRSGTLKIELVH